VNFTTNKGWYLAGVQQGGVTPACCAQGPGFDPSTAKEGRKGFCLSTISGLIKSLIKLQIKTVTIH
jgi:hypothetical protein